MGLAVPKISVVTISYNAVKEIEATLQSVLNQSYSNLEYIIIDGGSTDGTAEIIKSYAENPIFSSKIKYWISEKDKGIYDAMNKGIKHATGEYINFMNAGDSFYSSNIIDEIFGVEKQSADIIYGDAILSYPYYKLYCQPRQLEEFPNFDPIFHQASFTKTILLKQNSFDISFRIAGDYHFFYNRYIEGKEFKYYPYPIAIFDANDGISSTAFGLRLEEGRRITQRPKDRRFIVFKLKILIKQTVKGFLERLNPQFAAKVRKKHLLRNPRIKELSDK